MRHTARPENSATFTYVEGTTGNRPSWQFSLPYWVIYAAVPKQHDAMALAMIRMVIEAVEQNKNKPVPFYRNTLKSLKEIEEIVQTNHTTFGITLAPPPFRAWMGNIKRMIDTPDSDAIGGIVADAMRQAYEFGADKDKLITTYMLIYGG